MRSSRPRRLAIEPPGPLTRSGQGDFHHPAPFGGGAGGEGPGATECIQAASGESICVISCETDPDCPAGMKCFMKSDAMVTPATIPGVCA